MKLLKIEKVWLLLTLTFYVLYNIPGFPPYNNTKLAFIHAALTVIPLWITVYVGLGKVFKKYKLKE